MLLIIIVSIIIIIKVLFYLLYFRKKKANKSVKNSFTGETLFKVAIIVPAYNEEKVILNTLESLNKLSYPDLQIIVVDDGSQDNTLHLIKAHYEQVPKFRILSQKNRGKAFALNYGIQNADSDIVLCIDADTIADPDMLNHLTVYFNDAKVAAVAGTVKVKNLGKVICDMQAMEYLVNQNYEREVFESINGILVIPGAIGAFRTDVLRNLGGYTNDTLSEDTDVTLKMLCAGYDVINAPDVVGYTEVPATLSAFIKQRVRWKVGTLQVLIKYHKQAMSGKNYSLQLIVMPYTWVYCIVMPCVIPFVDFAFFGNAIMYNNFYVLSYYLFYIILDLIISASILFTKKSRPINIPYLLLLRFLLRQFTLFSYIGIGIRWINGTLFKWEKSVRYGVQDV